MCVVWWEGCGGDHRKVGGRVGGGLAAQVRARLWHGGRGRGGLGGGKAEEEGTSSFSQ